MSVVDASLIFQEDLFYETSSLSLIFLERRINFLLSLSDSRRE